MLEQIPLSQGVLKPASTGPIEQVRSWPAFNALRSEWNDLATRAEGQLFSSYEFLACWLAHFAREGFLVLAVRDTCGRLTAVLPLVRRRSTIYGIPARQWHSASNAHSGRFDLLAEDPAGAARTIIAHLMARGDWDVIVLTDVFDRSAALELLGSASAAGMSTGRWRAPDSPVLDLPADWKLLESALSGSFRAGLRRKRRQLMQHGCVAAGRVVDDLSVLEEGMALEARGWKGRKGTAMIQESSTRAFYLDLAARMAKQEMLVLWTLRVDGRLVAFQYGLEHDGIYSLLKLAYDEDFARFSPGQLLMEAVLKDAIVRGMKRFDFLGDSMPWKQAWRPGARGREWIYLFNSSPTARLVHALKFRFAPALRRYRERS